MQDIRNAALSPRDRAVCANALDRILERKRILRMKPAPKPVDADKYKEHQKKRRQVEGVSFTEIEPAGAAPAPVPGFAETEPTQPPNVAVEHEMQDMPGFPGAQIMVVKKPRAWDRVVGPSLKDP
jgi:hypothetical protein